MLILSAVTLMIVTNEGIFEKAEEARFKEELSRLQEELERFKLAKVSETQGEFEETSLSANKLWLYYEPVEYVANGTIKEVMPSISKKMQEKIEVLNGDIIFSGNEKEKEWAKELGINKTVKIENGVLLSDKDNLSILSEDGTFTVPSSVTVIGEGSFSQLGDKIKKVIIPYTVNEIAKNAFRENTSIEEVEIQTREIDNQLKGLSKIGDYAFQECTALKKIILPDTIINVGNTAFGNCTNLLDLKLPNNDVSFGSSTFYKCISLTSIEIPPAIKTLSYGIFTGCTNLENVTLNEGLMKMDSNAFISCTKIKNINLPSSLTSIGAGVFSTCSILERIEIGDNITTIPANAFYGCRSLTTVSIGKSVSSIDSTAFTGCTKLNDITINSENNNFSISSSILLNKDKTQMIYIFPGAISDSQTTFTIPDTVTSISGNLLSSFSKIKKVIIPESVNSININFFTSTVTEIEVDDNNSSYADYNNGLYKKNAQGIKTELIYYLGNEKIVDLPNGLEIIKTSSLTGAKVNNVNTVNTPDSLTTIEDTSISNKIQNINIGKKVSNINCKAFGDISNIQINIDPGNNYYVFESGVLYGIDEETKAKTTLIKALNLQNSDFTVPEGVQKIGGGAFWNNTQIGTINLNDVNSMGQYAFRSSTLTSVVFSDKLTELPSGCFTGCKGLIEMNIPEGITAIRDGCFGSCANLKTVTVPSSVTTIGSYCFENSNKNLIVKINKKKGTISGSPWGHIQGDKGIQWF